MNSSQNARYNYYTKHKEKIIKMSLDYYYENKEIVLLKNRLHAKNYYERIKNTPIYFKKALLASIRFQIKSKTKYFLKNIFKSWHNLGNTYGSKVVDKIVVSFDQNIVRLKLIGVSVKSVNEVLMNIAVELDEP